MYSSPKRRSEVHHLVMKLTVPGMRTNESERRSLLGNWPGGSLVAIGGGYLGEHADTYSFERPPNGAEHWPVQTTPIDERILALSGKRRPRVLLVPTATENSPRHDLGLFMAAFRNHWTGLGASVDVMRLLPKSIRDSDPEEKIRSADVVFVSGGVTHQLLACWNESGVAAMIRSAAEAGTVLAGSSAGAVCWFAACCSNSHYRYTPYRLACLGWIDAVVCPHWDTHPFRHKPFAEMLRTEPVGGIAIDELAALEVDGEGYRVLSIDGSSWVYACGWRGGEFRVDRLPDQGDLVLAIRSTMPASLP